MRIEKRHALAWFALYTLAYGITLLNDGVFWDGWAVFNSETAAINGNHVDSGRPLFAYYQRALLVLGDSPIQFRILNFSLYFLSGLCLATVLRRIREIDLHGRFWIVTFFLLFPVNFARICINMSVYAISSFLFFLAFSLLAAYLENRRGLFRLAALAVFALSFVMESCLLLYAVAWLYLAYVERRSVTSLTTLGMHLLRYADVLLLPVAFWTIKSLWFKPYGPYGLNVGYNNPTIHHLRRLPQTLITSSNEVFFAIVNQSAGWLLAYPYLTLCAAILLFILLNRFLCLQEQQVASRPPGYTLLLVLLGCIVFILGVVGYLAVGKIPYSHDWFSRHQILTPLGASLLLYFGAQLFFDTLIIRQHVRVFVYTLITCLFVLQNFTGYLEYTRDMFKQEALMQAFRDSPIIRSNSTFIFYDLTPTAHGRIYRFYEWTGMMKYVFGDETRFGDTGSRFAHSPPSWQQLTLAQFNARGYTPTPPDYDVFIRPGTYPLSLLGAAKLSAHRIFNRKMYPLLVSRLVQLEYQKSTSTWPQRE